MSRAVRQRHKLCGGTINVHRRTISGRAYSYLRCQSCTTKVHEDDIEVVAGEAQNIPTKARAIGNNSYYMAVGKAARYMRKR